MNNKAIYAAIVIGVIFVLGISAYAMNSSDNSSQTTDNSAVDNSTSGADGTEQEGVRGAIASPTEGKAEASSAVLTIMFSDNGYDKDRYEAKVGDVIAVKNTASVDTQFSSDVHPTHKDESELNLPIQKPGDETTFSVTKAGTFGFHDHLDASQTAVLIVTE